MKPSARMQELFWRSVLTPEQFNELASSSDTPCDVRPPGAPAEVSCPFRKGHKCACRFFGKLEGGAL